MTAHIKIDVYDVASAGGVEHAIEAWCARSEHTSSGVVGPSFATSGPGVGWSCEFDSSDFAARAVEGGALYYVDSSSGHMIAAEEVDEDECDENGEWPDDVICDLGGGHSRLSDWSSGSVVELICPDVEDATDPDHIAAVAKMARSVISHHYAESDCAAWRQLVEAVRNASAALEGIDLDDFEGC